MAFIDTTKTQLIKNLVGMLHDIFEWCKAEAERQQIKEQDYWGGLVLDEMKVQVWVYYI